MQTIDYDTNEIVDELATLDDIRDKYHALSLITNPLDAIAQRDMGMALIECLKRKGASLETQNAVARYTALCEHKAGTLYVEMPKNEGTRLGGNTVFPPSETPTLAALGINKAEAGRLRLVAELDDDEVQEYIEDTATKGQEITLAGLRKRGKAKRRAKKRAEHEAQAQAAPVKPSVIRASWADWLPEQPDCDLLITDPPYATDIDNIYTFAAEWLPVALSAVRPTGRAYVCIGAYPDEIKAYLEADHQHMILAQILVWTYRNTLGPTPRDDYKLNWQAILYFRGTDAPPLDCPELNEQWSVQDVAAPDGRHGNRYHEWQKPDQLAERLIRHSTKPGDLVLDPFAGTGTFLLAATRLGREARGCDIDESMLAIAVQRGCDIE